jgi:hypothetical protein
MLYYYPERRILFTIMLNVIMLSVVKLCRSNYGMAPGLTHKYCARLKIISCDKTL